MNISPGEIITCNRERALGIKHERSWLGYTVSALNPCDWMEWGLAVYKTLFDKAGAEEARKYTLFTKRETPTEKSFCSFSSYFYPNNDKGSSFGSNDSLFSGSRTINRNWSDDPNIEELIKAVEKILPLT